MRIFENENYDESILPISKFKLFCDIDAKYQPKEKNVVEQAIKEADEALTKEIPHLWAHLYPDFLKKGERAEYERLFFCR
ncbi:MAG: hypothetical protein IJQ50_03815, partial [Clostridia bacterium]|nr:hypothetical protein [Clostridia bacterium]